MARRSKSASRRAGIVPVSGGVALAVVLALGALSLIGARVGHRGGAGQAAIEAGDDAASAAGRTATAPARSGEQLFARIAGMWTAADRIAELEAENRELMAWKALAERLAERNARYETLLRMPPDAFGQGADIEHAIAAQLVLDSGGPFTRTLVANAGADHGVRVGYIAVNEHGLIGRVVLVGRRSSRILMLDDYNSRIPVMGEASRVRAVLAGQATQPPDLITRPFAVESPRLDFVVGAADLREGERVITSGDGGLFPRGIPVGVARAGRDGAWRVALAASQQPIDFVRILPFAGADTPDAEPVADAAPLARAPTPDAPAQLASAAPEPASAPRAEPPPQRAAAPPQARPTPPQASEPTARAAPAPTPSPPAPRATPAPTTTADAAPDDQAPPP